MNGLLCHLPLAVRCNRDEVNDTPRLPASLGRERAVERGLARKERRIPPYLGVDEKAFAKRHRYETIVCDLKQG
ncbi:MAG: hypothetical protein HY695_35525, partial [Deltaproteobacteria bacterium]|nr:hypothetical protein [Deltaproteobacteria bacterium]